MDINFFHQNPPRTRFAALCEDEVYLERNINLIQETLGTLYDEKNAFNKQNEFNNLKKALIDENIKTTKSNKVVSINQLKEYNSAINDINRAINAIEVKILKTNTLIEYNENLLSEEKARLKNIQKELDGYGHVIEHEFR